MIKNVKKTKSIISTRFLANNVCPDISFCIMMYLFALVHRLFASPPNFRELLLESFLVGTLDLPKEAALTLNAISRSKTGLCNRGPPLT